MSGKAAQVIINLPTREINKPFSYLIPGHLDFLDVGWRVITPFGGRSAEGFIVEISDADTLRPGGENAGQQLKYITAALDENRWFDRHMLEVAKWLSDYYLVSLAQALRLFIPGKAGVKFAKTYRANDQLNLASCMEKLVAKPAEYGLLLEYIHKNKTVSKSELKKIIPAPLASPRGQAAEKEIPLENIISYLLRHNYICAADTAVREGKPVYKTIYFLTVSRQEALDALEGVLRKKTAQQKLIRELLARNNNEIEAAELKKLKITASTAQNLVKTGLAAIKKVRLMRDSYLDFNNSAPACLNLSPEQQAALDAFAAALDAGRFQSFLLKGITGSGKTQVYIEAAAKTRALDRQVIVLVPEIALTSQIVRRFKAVFGDDVVVIHSKLSLGERNDAWQQLYSNQAGIVIGARSAVFAPAANLGLIILDEEHEFTYKQEETPRYHAKQVAIKRAELAGATVIFGSATPSVETYYEAMSGKHTLLNMPTRINDLAPPPVEIVDMRQEMAQGRRKVISQVMSDLVAEALVKKEQAIILLNRRGYATFVLCRECGHVLRCGHCDIALVYHIAAGELKCHYCLERHQLPDVCPACESRYIRYFGSGTQKVEEEIKLHFDAARIIRMDQDTTGGKMGHDKILSAFAKGEYDILLGTQMVAKGHDVPNVTAVGIVSADTALNLPDFRAAERTFSLVMQAAGRAGRGEKPGRVVLQTYNPAHYAVTAAAKHDYEAFYKQEITYRRELGYPPFLQLIKITVQSKTESEAISQSGAIAAKLKQASPKLTGTFIIGPFPAATYKIKNIYRINIIIKTSRREMAAVKELILRLGIFEMKEALIDVDPLNVL